MTEQAGENFRGSDYSVLIACMRQGKYHCSNMQTASHRACPVSALTVVTRDCIATLQIRTVFDVASILFLLATARLNQHFEDLAIVARILQVEGVIGIEHLREV